MAEEVQGATVYLVPTSAMNVKQGNNKCSVYCTVYLSCFVLLKNIFIFLSIPILQNAFLKEKDDQPVLLLTLLH